MRLRVTAATHRGRRRMRNEDGLLVASREATSIFRQFREGLVALEVGGPCVLAVADGMGGEEGGSEASSIALAATREIFSSYLITPSTRSSQAALWAVEFAHHSVRAGQQRDDRLVMMGSTLTAIVIDDSLTPAGEGLAYLGHVGDSRAYLVRHPRGGVAPQVEQLTEDHSTIAELVRSGYLQLDEERQRTHPYANQITRVLGQPTRLVVDQRAVAVHPGERLILCSDGLWGEIPGPELRAAMAAPGATAGGLLEMALAAGGTDNVTVIVAEVVT